MLTCHRYTHQWNVCSYILPIFQLDYLLLLSFENSFYILDSRSLSDGWLVNIFSWRRQWHPTPVLLPGKSHGRRSLESCSPWCHWGSDTTERLHFDFSFLCIGEGNGNPLQCSCLENPRDRGACWAAIYGVTQSRTRLKRPSSSSKYITGGAKVNTFCSQKNLLKKKISRAWYHLKHVSSFNSLKVEQWPVSLFPDLLPCNKG